MTDSNNEVSSLLQKILLSLNNHVMHKPFINGPEFIRQNKILASLYIKLEKEMDSIFHLTESHAATFRQKVINACNMNKIRNNNHDTKFCDSETYELQEDYLLFNSDYFLKGSAGVLERLKEMPKEWTIVQLTFEVKLHEKFYGSFKDDVSDIVKLYLARLPCGELVEERGPSVVEIPPPLSWKSKGLPSILEVIRESVKKITAPNVRKEKKRELREEASSTMKGVITRECIPTWLSKWCCLMIGSLVEDSTRYLVKNTIDRTLASFPKNEISNISKQKITLLYQIADGCAHLSENDILEAVKHCSLSDGLTSSLIANICVLKNEHSHTLMRAKRNPVLLVLDDDLDIVPWEMLPILFKHPVSRVPSLHFAHALYHRHKDHIVNGNRIIKSSDVAFFIVNPNKDLNNTEQYLLNFFKKRLPHWKGISGEKPSSDIFVRSLIDFNVFMYSGHGSGAQFLNPEDVYKLNTDAIPFLFGCSSATKRVIGEGGKNELRGVSDPFLVAGCPCYIGMLWPVTTTDVDIVTMMLLNITMAGSPININDIVGTDVVESSEVFLKEPQLLRALKSARSAAKLYTNSAALIARGIPVEFQD